MMIHLDLHDWQGNYVQVKIILHQIMQDAAPTAAAWRERKSFAAAYIFTYDAWKFSPRFNLICLNGRAGPTRQALLLRRQLLIDCIARAHILVIWLYYYIKNKKVCFENDVSLVNWGVDKSWMMKIFVKFNSKIQRTTNDKLKTGLVVSVYNISPHRFSMAEPLSMFGCCAVANFGGVGDRRSARARLESPAGVF